MARCVLVGCCCVLLGLECLAAEFGADLRGVDEGQARVLCGVAVKGVVVDKVVPDGLADDLGLRAKDVLTSVNAHRVSKPEDVLSEIGGPDASLSLAFVRRGRVRRASLGSSSSERIAFVGPETSETVELVKAAGLKVECSPNVPMDLSPYRAVVLENEEACTAQASDRLRDYLKHGGGVIVQGILPTKFADDWDLSRIADWFGCSEMARGMQDCELSAAVNKPLHTSATKGERLFSISGKVEYPWGRDGKFDEFSTLLAVWSPSWRGKPSGIFTHQYGDGRMFYQFKPSDPNYPKLAVLFTAGVKWVAKIQTSIGEGQ